MNWIGGARARAQNQNARGVYSHPKGRGRRNDENARNHVGPTGDTMDILTNSRYQILNDTSGSIHQRTVPLLEFVKKNFPNGEVLSLQLSHQMEIDITKDSFVNCQRMSDHDHQDQESSSLQSLSQLSVHSDMSTSEYFAPTPTTTPSCSSIQKSTSRDDDSIRSNRTEATGPEEIGKGEIGMEEMGQEQLEIEKKN